MLGRGGMKTVWKSTAMSPAPATATISRNIIEEDKPTALLGNESTVNTIWKSTTPVIALVNQITIDGDKPMVLEGREDAVCLVTIHDNGHETYGYEDAEMEEKRNDIGQVRQTMDEDVKLADVRTVSIIVKGVESEREGLRDLVEEGG
jgi:hypothetical protein